MDTVSLAASRPRWLRLMHLSRMLQSPNLGYTGEADDLLSRTSIRRTDDSRNDEPDTGGPGNNGVTTLGQTDQIA